MQPIKRMIMPPKVEIFCDEFLKSLEDRVNAWYALKEFEEIYDIVYTAAMCPKDKVLYHTCFITYKPYKE